MLDYICNSVALEDFTSALSAAPGNDAKTSAAKQKALAALKAEADSAMLGTLVHHLVWHAASDGSEVALLQRSSALWNQAVDLCSMFGKHRSDLQDALANPTKPNASDTFNNVTVAFQELRNSFVGMQPELTTIRKDIFSYRHIAAHPRQGDKAIADWDWGNILLARRTDAFVRALDSEATDSSTSAFALGAVAAYGANVAGSLYLGHVVGGPRRLHRYRDRIARNSVGNWFLINHAGAPSPSKIAETLAGSKKVSPSLPAKIRDQVQVALNKTFDTKKLRPLPDLDVGYQRLLAHLKLLDAFILPAVPTPPGQDWMAKIVGDPNSLPSSLRPQDIDIGRQDEGGIAVTYGSDPSPGTSSPGKSDSSHGCGIVLFLIILADLIQALVQCIVQLSKKHTCTFWENMLLSDLWKQDPPDPRNKPPTQNPGVTGQALTAIASMPEATSLVAQLWDAHQQAWEAMNNAYLELALAGLVYPRDLLTKPLYSQFLSIPPPRPWPAREEPKETTTYHLYPSTPLENPAVAASRFAVGDSPEVIYTSQLEKASSRSINLWRQMVLAEHDSQNWDLDGDRGIQGQCWAAKGPMEVDPIKPVILRYDEQ